MTKLINVMIVEDQPPDAELMLRELRQAGIRASSRVVQTEQEFLAELTPPPDLILADYAPPKFNGMRALQLLQERHLDIPLIIVSESIGDEKAVAALQSGAADHVLKNRLARLGPAVERALQAKRLREEKQQINQQLQQTERCLPGILDYATEAIIAVNSQHKVIVFNNAAENMFGYTAAEMIGKPLDPLLPPRFVEIHHQHMKDFAASPLQARPMEKRQALLARRKDGSEFPVEIGLSKLVEDGQSIVAAMIVDLTERRRAEQELATALDYVQTMIEKSPIGIITYMASGQAVSANSAAAQIIGATVEQLQAQNFRHIESWKKSGLLTAAEEALSTNRQKEIDAHFATTFGKEIWITCRLVPFSYQDERRLLALLTDIQERKRAEEELRRRADEFAALYDTARDLSIQTELSPLLKTIVDRATALLHATSGTLSLYDPAKRDLELVAINNFPAQLGMRVKLGEGVSGRVAQTREPMIVDDYATFDIRLPQYEGIAFNASLQVPMLFSGTLMGVLAVHELGKSKRKYTQDDARLLTLLASQAASAVNNARLFEETQRHLHHVQALHQIDIAVSGSVDLRTSLGVFLDHACAQLGVDAADVLLLNPHSQTLEFAAKRGFRTPALQYTKLRLGDGFAGKAALSRRTIATPDLIRDIDGLTRSPFIQREGFVSYFGVPLIAKGNVNGVLEIFHRSRLDPSQEWIEFLETLAGQAGIAIDSAQMHASLQRANIELSLAYDSTLEGWSAALDLRDRETEGHTQRVTEMTLRLSREMGIGERDLVHVRRGALLHDIGKMGIPDAILFKPGPLTEEEWKIMRKHPENAYQLLSPIAFLKPALDIPYCHHEKWDGTGYPRGLKGEQIPLAARIFAVADVWDALLSNRPYRQAWSKPDVVKHVRTLAGTHFDPRVAKIFLGMTS